MFLEGRKGKERVRSARDRNGNGKYRSRKGERDGDWDGEGDGEGDGEDRDDAEDIDGIRDERAGRGEKKPQTPVPGGKGIGGRWLFVSHEPFKKKDGDGCTTTQKFGLSPMPESPPHDPIITDDKSPHQLRFARFQFEPMVRTHVRQPHISTLLYINITNCTLLRKIYPFAS